MMHHNDRLSDSVSEQGMTCIQECTASQHHDARALGPSGSYPLAANAATTTLESSKAGNHAVSSAKHRSGHHFLGSDL
jgi:hypothetical protein